MCMYCTGITLRVTVVFASMETMVLRELGVVSFKSFMLEIVRVDVVVSTDCGPSLGLMH